MVNLVFAIRLVQWLGWVFETQERKKKSPRACFYENVSCMYVFFSTCCSTSVARVTYFVFCSIFITPFSSNLIETYVTVPFDVRTILPTCLSTFSIRIFVSQIPAYVYVNMYTHFPPLPYLYTLIAIFIYMVCVLFYTSTHNLFSSSWFNQFNRHLCHGAHWCTHNPVHVFILFFHLYLHISNIWTNK